MYTIVFATGNADKLREIRQIMADLPCTIISMKEAGLNPEIREDGTTFTENALIKARTVWEALPEGGKTVVMADDSGLEIDALDKEPGVWSARYMGENTSYEIKNANLLARLEGVPDKERTARFVCAAAAVLPDGRELTVRETIEGRIGYEPRGKNGFGYDPIFYLPDLSRSTAELEPEEKNRISHRGKAMQAMARKLTEVFA